MKSPWQLGFLALAVTGVSTYDYVFFKNYHPQKPATIQMTAPQQAAILEEPLLSPLPESANAENSTEPTAEEARPSISRENLLHQARQMYVMKDYSESGLSASWPDRDPFATQEAVDRLPSNIPIIPAQKGRTSWRLWMEHHWRLATGSGYGNCPELSPITSF
jgi:hypothetical protein